MKKRKIKPWVSQEILNLSDERKHYKHSKMIGDEDAKKKYNSLTKTIKKKSKLCKEQWILERCKEVEGYNQQNNTRKLFQKVEEICGKHKVTATTIMDKSGKMLEGREEIKDRWKQHFEELYNISGPKNEEILQKIPAT